MAPEERDEPAREQLETAEQPEEPMEQEQEEPEDTAEKEEEKAGVEGGSYVMDEEEYEETKKDLSELVSELNDIIAARNYSRWLKYLTKEYKEYYSDPEVLREFSDAPVLKKYDIKLRTLKDYFNYVVVASRKNVQVDEIQAIGPEKVKAYMYVDGEPVVVYTLEKVGDEWKITK